MTTARTMTDREINEGAKFYVHHEADGESDITCYPCIELGGDSAMQVYVYAENGMLHIALHYDTAGPDEDGRGPWAYYGPDSAIPTVITGGNGLPVYEELPGEPAGPVLTRLHALTDDELDDERAGLAADLAALRAHGEDRETDYLPRDDQ